MRILTIPQTKLTAEIHMFITKTRVALHCHEGAALVALAHLWWKPKLGFQIANWRLPNYGEHTCV
jgi:hypothetical protein